ncbi:MAG: sigma-70 family RNA polymerase sigma factor [Verrucomicrobiota bacterium]
MNIQTCAQRTTSKKSRSLSPKNTDTTSELISQHWRIAFALAYEYRNIPRLEYDDVLQCARISLVKAANHYDANKGASFSTYAWKVIQNDLNTLYSCQKKKAAREILFTEFKQDNLSSEDEHWTEQIHDETIDIAHELERREVCRLVMDLTHRLPERQKMTALGVMQGKNYQQIGRQLGIAPSSRKTLVSRAYYLSLQNLKEQLSALGIT